jgi:hypothetical protein
VSLEVWPQRAARVRQLDHFEPRSVAHTEAESAPALFGPRGWRLGLRLQTECIPIEAQRRL